MRARVSVVCGLSFALAAVAARPAAADPAMLASQWLTAAEPVIMLDTRWPGLPEDHSLSLEDQINKRIDSLGDRLSRETFRLQIDARHRCAHLQLGNGDSGDALGLQVAEDIQFDDANTYVHTRLDLRYHGETYRLALPAIEMSPAAYRGDYGVEIKLPLLMRQF